MVIANYLNNPYPKSRGKFGSAVAISGDYALLEHQGIMMSQVFLAFISLMVLYGNCKQC